MTNTFAFVGAIHWRAWTLRFGRPQTQRAVGAIL